MMVSDHLRRISDGPVDAIDAEHLKAAALMIEAAQGVVDAAKAVLGDMEVGNWSQYKQDALAGAIKCWERE